jgi:predicted N-formylglutamate amidohydrolase
MTATTLQLLAADEPPAVIEARSDGASPFLLVCDHAGRRIPRRLGDLGVNAGDLTRHIAWDVGIEGVGCALAGRFDACLIMQPYSRLVIDCNRKPGVASSISKVSELTTIPGNENVSAEDAGQRRREIFAPYHDAITRRLDQRLQAGQPTILIALHSFTPVFGGIPRPWHCGLLYNRDRALAAPLLGLLRADPALVVGDNEPYSVTDDTDYTIPVHGEQRNVPHVAIEIRHDLIDHEIGLRKWTDKLADLLPKAAAKL